MSALPPYLPQDRLRALARGETLPNRTTGSALFADISGFTPLTEKLTRELGARRGAEELTHQINAVYDALIAEIEKHGGSVINFAGDAITCWFDAGDGTRAPAQAVACALALQATMLTFPAALKVAVTTGEARRFIVGDPTIQLLDTLAGATIARLASAEHFAERGDIVVDEATADACGEPLGVRVWRTDPDSAQRFAVCDTFMQTVEIVENPVLPASLPAEALHAWVLPEVYAREQSGHGAFLTEFRPCVALFVRFTGIDYEADSAEQELDAFIRNAQSIASRHEGTLLQITIGDKGSYAYFNFGAMSVHEDKARRAVRLALALRAHTTLALQLGVTQGVMRVGDYGGRTRKTFGALGDEVNLAARLMTAAAPGEVLVSRHVRQAVENQFVFEPRPPLKAKGKTEPLTVFAVTGESQRRAVRLQEPAYSLPMVGRTQELQIIHDKLELAAKGQGQVIGIVAEAGVGKSRLVAEVIRAARQKGFIGLGGACQSDGLHTPYLAWKSIWQASFEIDPEMPVPEQIRFLESEIEKRAPSRREAIPLLNVVLDLNIPENDFTQHLEPKTRQSTLHILLEDCLKAQAKDEPTLIVLEDLHWIDALSHNLLEELAKALAQYAVCFVLAYRPPQLERLQTPRLEALAQFTPIELHELTTAEAESAIRAKLTQLYPASGGALPVGLVETLMGRAQGNPFYLEELLNYVHDRGLDPADIGNIELPDSLHTLILSRIDQLSDQKKTTLKVASIVGRLFRARWLTGYYPELGPFPEVKAALDDLDKLEITPLDSEPELSYLFKHIVTHEVTYENLPFATRAKLHEQLARYLENADAPVETIAFHYGRTENQEKQREYLRKAGETAQKNFANEAALEYYGRLLPLLQDRNEAISVYMLRGQVLELMGRLEEAANGYRAVLDLAQDNLAWQADAWYAWGKLSRLQNEYTVAIESLERAKALYTLLNNAIGEARARIDIGYVLLLMGEYVQAKEPITEGLREARSTADELSEAAALQGLGYLAWARGDLHLTHSLYEEARSIRHRLGDKLGTALLISNIASTLANLGDTDTAHTLYGETLALQREIGHKYGMADTLIKQGYIAFSTGNYGTAQTLVEEGLTLNREIGSKSGIAFAYVMLGELSFARLDYQQARVYFEESLTIARAINNKWQIVAQLHNLGIVAYHEQEYARARAIYEEGLQLCEELKQISQMAFLLLGLSLVELVENRPEARSEARAHLLESLRLREETGEHFLQPSNLIGLAALALQEGQPKRAAQFLGAVQSALATIKTGLSNFYHRPHAQTLAMVREQLGEDAFTAAWQEGTHWTLEEAVKKALEEEKNGETQT